MNWVWTAWLAVIASSFAAFESYAIAKNKTTLSRYVWNLTKAWPPLPFIGGLLVGGLAVHFWWACQGCPLEPAKSVYWPSDRPPPMGTMDRPIGGDGKPCTPGARPGTWSCVDLL